jgi:hypothetical protein
MAHVIGLRSSILRRGDLPRAFLGKQPGDVTLDMSKLGGVLNLLRHQLATQIEEPTSKTGDFDVDLVIPEFPDFMWFHLFIVSMSESDR